MKNCMQCMVMIWICFFLIFFAIFLLLFYENSCVFSCIIFSFLCCPVPDGCAAFPLCLRRAFPFFFSERSGVQASFLCPRQGLARGSGRTTFFLFFISAPMRGGQLRCLLGTRRTSCGRSEGKERSDAVRASEWSASGTERWHGAPAE